MRYCEHCGGRVPPNSKFCPLCGERLALLPPQDERPAESGREQIGAADTAPQTEREQIGAADTASQTEREQIGAAVQSAAAGVAPFCGSPVPPAAFSAPPANMPPYGMPVPSPMNGMPPYEMQPLPRAYFVQAQMPRKRVGSFSIVGFTLSCFSMLLFYFGLLGLLFAGTGLVLSAVGIGKRRTMSLWGLGLAGVIVGVSFYSSASSCFAHISRTGRSVSCLCRICMDEKKNDAKGTTGISVVLFLCRSLFRANGYGVSMLRK